MIRLLIVDDSPLMRRLLGGIFEAEGDFIVDFARDGAEAIDKLHAFEPQVITLDINMPRLDGIACLDRIMVERPCPVVMVSARTEEGAADTIEALELGAVDFVPKPDGAISLEIDRLAPLLVEKVRGASAARLPASLRLADRVRARRGLRATRRRASALAPATAARDSATPRAAGERLVLVGTSTGGPQALETLLTGLPADFPLPILVAQHMPAAFTGALARRLDRICAISVVEVSRPALLLPGTAYIARGEADMILRRRRDGLVAASAPSDPGHRWHPSVERLVRSAMALLPAQDLVGVLMTGMGNDGAPAMTELRRLGGHTLAEAEESAIIWGMPGELVKAGGAEIVAPLGQLSARLVEVCA